MAVLEVAVFVDVGERVSVGVGARLEDGVAVGVRVADGVAVKAGRLLSPAAKTVNLVETVLFPKIIFIVCSPGSKSFGGVNCQFP